MTGKFYCKHPGGYKRMDSGGEVQVHLLEGTREKGPFYQAWKFSDEQIERWIAKGIIEMVE